MSFFARLIVIDSIRNWERMFRCLVLMVLCRSISFVRFVIDTSMMFMMSILSIKREIAVI